MFFKSLFDFKFEKFVTRQVASVMYAVLVGITAVFAAIAVVWCLTRALEMAQYGESGGVFLYFAAALVGVPVAGFLYLVIIRVAFESSIALVAIAENTKRNNN